MQDWNYITRGTFEVTVELACSYFAFTPFSSADVCCTDEKTPPSKDLQGYYEVRLFRVKCVVDEAPSIG
jgi:hypothetical protein